jgi:GH15 family glucan-1,4-alpha-glucosidase
MEPIGDYALIGDCRGAALVSRRGAIDWLCWPRFDSPPLCDALVDPNGGAWSLAPPGRFESTRRYLPGSNVLQTHFVAGGGELVLTDLMPVASEADKSRHLFADHEILRRIECTRGEVELRMRFRPRRDYRQPVAFDDRGALGFRARVDGGILRFRGEVPCENRGDAIEARFRLRAGEVVRFSLTLALEQPAVLPPLGEAADLSIARTLAWWRSWVAELRYDGPYREAVERSALTLRQLVFAPSGAVVAAPTTSLPERVGGSLNWDYRYCWLRDASLTVRALFGLGYDLEAHAFVSWLLHSTRLTRPRLRILYDVYGREPPDERELPLAGYAGSQPVRAGNGAKEQLQLDVYGEVIDATMQAWRRRREIDRETRRMLLAFGRFIARAWDQPDEGIWEPRSGRARHTHSYLMSWVALDRLLQLHACCGLKGIDVADVEREHERIRRAISTRAWNPRLGSYTATLDGDDLDASVLLLGWYRFEDPRSSRMRSTYEAVCKNLGAGGGLLYRYHNGDSPGEGAFVVCAFWAIELLASGAGSLAEAESALEQLLARRNDVGLLAEEIDPASSQQLGNFPQAFSHIGLINAAISVEKRRQEEWSHERRLG